MILVTELKKSQVKYDTFEFSTLENHAEVYDETNEKVPGNFKIEVPKSLEIYEVLH